MVPLNQIVLLQNNLTQRWIIFSATICCNFPSSLSKTTYSLKFDPTDKRPTNVASFWVICGVLSCTEQGVSLSPSTAVKCRGQAEAEWLGQWKGIKLLVITQISPVASIGNLSASLAGSKKNTIIGTWKPLTTNRHVGSWVGTLVSWGMLTLCCFLSS